MFSFQKFTKKFEGNLIFQFNVTDNAAMMKLLRYTVNWEIGSTCGIFIEDFLVVIPYFKETM